MAGEERIDEVVAYVARLMGEVPSADEPLRLRSVHRAALASWARKQSVPVRLGVISSGAPFSVRELLAAEEQDSIPVPAKAISAPPSTSEFISGSFGGIGIDIEDVESLPQATDYREHPFFQDNFTPAEIAYCVRQSDVRASLCGNWAAKEAVLKSGLVAAPAGYLKSIEIKRDDVGRPIFPRCQISISHTAKTAVAVCVVAGATTPVQRPATQVEGLAETQNASHSSGGNGKRWPWSRARE